MGRTRTLKSAVIKAKSSKSSTLQQEPSVAALIDKAQTLIVQCDYELARRFLQRVLEQDRSHVEAREMLGFVEVESGNLAAAKEVFASLIPPSTNAAPSPPPSAYLYLAQLTESAPRTVLDMYQAGLDLLVTKLKGKALVASDAPNRDEAETRKMIVQAIIGMVEVWMTDLCFEPEAEEKCISLLQIALNTDPQNVEALQCLASVKMSQQQPEQALELAQRAWAPWKDLGADDSSLPPFSSRLSLTRLFIELSQYNAALAILEDIMASDDQDVEAWYLEGWCLFLMADRIKEGAPVEGSEAITWEDMKRDARDCLETCKTVHLAQQHPDEQLLSHVEELLRELESAGIKPTPDWEGVEGGNEDEDDDWEDEDEADGDVTMK